jgi:hypothetical protein
VRLGFATNVVFGHARSTATQLREMAVLVLDR